MQQSLYLTLAVLFVRADIKREERRWRRQIRRVRYDIPWDNSHLLKDIGLELDGRVVGECTLPDAIIAQRRVRHLRRVLTSRIPT